MNILLRILTNQRPQHIAQITRRKVDLLSQVVHRWQALVCRSFVGKISLNYLFQLLQ